jgi:hypothetical protein
MKINSAILKSLYRDLVILIVVGVIIGALSFAIGYIFNPPEAFVEVHPTFLKDASPKPQPVGVRTWREYQFDKLLVIDSTAVAQPMVMQLDRAGNIYILDWSDFRIKMFSPNGALVKTFGEGKGSFTNPTDFAVGSTGEVWVCDPPQRKITGFNADGGVMRTISPQRAVDRITLADNRLIAMASPGGTTLFEIYSPSGERLKTFGELIENQPEYGIALDGNVIVDEERQRFFYGSLYAGMLAAYDIQGQQRFIAQTIDGISLPVVQIMSRGIKVQSNSPLAILGIRVLGDQLYVLSGSTVSTDGNAKAQIMDVYDKRDGTYLFSFRLPLACSDILIQSDRLYTLGKDEVTGWQFKPKA